MEPDAAISCHPAIVSDTAALKFVIGHYEMAAYYPTRTAADNRPNPYSLLKHHA
jgi:hypothetical protein